MKWTVRWLLMFDLSGHFLVNKLCFYSLEPSSDNRRTLSFKPFVSSVCTSAQKGKCWPSKQQQNAQQTMASGGLTCTICYECFNDENLCPRVLSCGHSFCSVCVEKLMEYTAINCPTCKQTYTVLNGVGDLPKNFALLEIMDTINAIPQHADNRVSPIFEEIRALATKAMSQVEEIRAARDRVSNAICDMYKNREESAARIQFFFNLELHDRLTTRKKVLMEELDQFFQNTADMSPVFTGLTNTFAFLSIKNASGHKCMLQAEAVRSKCRQKMMNAVTTNASTDDKEIKTAEAPGTGEIQVLKQVCEEVACETQGLFIKLHEELTAREQVLIDKLNKLYIEKQSILFKQLQRLAIIQARLESTIQPVMSNIQSLNHDDLLAVAWNIKSMLGELESQCIVLEPEAEYVPDVTFDADLTMWSLHNLNCYELVCAIRSIGAVSDKSTCAATTTATGFGLMCAQLGNEASFTITAYDAQGCRRGLGSDVFVVELKENAGEGKVAINLENKGDGTYLATYTVPEDARIGDYTLSVLLRGAHIQDSPFVVRVGH